MQETIAFVTWLLLILCLFIYVGKEIYTWRIMQYKGYFKRLATYRNIAIIISIPMVTYNPLIMMEEDELVYKRWQYHVSSLACLFVWLEMADLFSKIHLFGKYIHMFK